jgi:hypothetical protein
MIESASQRIFVLWLVYGEKFWNALDKTISGIFSTVNNHQYILWLALMYLSLHALTGILIAIFLIKSTGNIQSKKVKFPFIEIPENLSSIFEKKENPKKGLRFSFILIWIIMVALLLQSTFHIGNPVLQQNVIFNIITRAILIILTWNLFINPLLTSLLKKWLINKKKQSQQELATIIEFLPVTKYIVEQSWKLSSVKKGIGRVNLFLKITISNILTTNNHA